ncbi:Gas vesicle protein GvpA (modular protein) [Frankia canadensis]|uniref:Gas vesicle protein GvpA (Modular protein) n=1 Tax=Frankia canadensis TaxID=1836972 RepID=A0A2I2KN90_9ACTN|nr:gas vesicle protein [Frankia canadensis]SNQ47133.1 Gas vesicle protein GvpA (modular protein) [Frankia canadensis]SOU54423.1 Gas vesicle protein GvpA (modular protein) [Frankia canadensis]
MADPTAVPRARAAAPAAGGTYYHVPGASPRAQPTPRAQAPPQGQALVDLLDRLVDSGAVVSGQVVVALAGVELLKVDLRLLLVGVQTAIEGGRRGGSPGGSASAPGRPS